MADFRAWVARLVALFGRRRREIDFADELNAHLDQLVDDNVHAGMTLGEARRAALAASGGLVQTAEAYRDRLSLPFVETMMLDLQYAWRMLRKTPGFSAIAIATLALGIGANTAIFSVINAVLIEPLPFRDPSRLVVLWEEQVRRPGRPNVVSPASPLGLAPAIEREIQSFDKDQPVADVRTMDQWMSRALSRERFSSTLLAVFAGLALLLASIGIYGVMSYAVSQRQSEIGVRLALGAEPASVRQMILGAGLRLVVAGLAIGLGAGLMLSRALTSLLYETRLADPATIASVTLLLAAVATVAIYLPARRASRLNPIVALRAEWS